MYTLLFPFLYIFSLDVYACLCRCLLCYYMYVFLMILAEHGMVDVQFKDFLYFTVTSQTFI